MSESLVMCGIVAIRCVHHIVPDALEALRCMEYRGYDSAGLALLSTSGELCCFYSLAGIDPLEHVVQNNDIQAHIAIGHTRWATHGAPALRNTHPICVGPLVIVHNGIVSNDQELLTALRREQPDYRPQSETDTEILLAWIAHYCAQGASLQEAAAQTIAQTTGDFSFVILHTDTEELLAYAQGTSLICHVSEDRIDIVSDPNAFAEDVQNAFALPEKTYLRIQSAQQMSLITATGQPYPQNQLHYFSHQKRHAQKTGYDSFMQKEMTEQPQALQATAQSIAAQCQQWPAETWSALRQCHLIVIIGCGSSYHAGLCARSWFENTAGILTEVDIASECMHRPYRFPRNTLFIAISQSGETYDTIQAVIRLRDAGYEHILGICNTPHARLCRLCTRHLLTAAGPEISVASTKAFTTQLLCLYQLSHFLGEVSPMSGDDLVASVNTILTYDQPMKSWAQSLSQHEHIFFMGRGAYYAIALEGALKMKEISYQHAEAFATGELKHGPLALLQADTPVIFLLPNDMNEALSRSNLQEILSRGAPVFVLTSLTSLPLSVHAHCYIDTRKTHDLSPLLYSITLQLLAYHTACARGCNVDRPRHLAKSVTVA